MSYQKIMIPVAIAAASFISGCSGKKEKNKIENISPITVSVSTPAQTNMENAITISGQVEAAQTATIGTRVMGYITGIFVKPGDHVRTGQLLFTISSQDITAQKAGTDAQLTQAEAALVNAQKDFDRFSALFKQQSATAKELENAGLQLQVAGSNAEAVRQARNQVAAQQAYTRVTAPFDGMITQKQMDVGSLANPGMPVLILEQSNKLQVSAAVPESQVSSVKLNDPVTLTIKSIGKSFTGKVIQLSPSSQFTGGQYIIKISIPENEKQNLYAGMYVNAQLAGDTKIAAPASQNNQLLVPETSIIHEHELTGLYSISQHNTALLRWVRLGKKQGNNVEVLSGLGADELFITHAEGKLYNGAPVKTTP